MKLTLPRILLAAVLLGLPARAEADKSAVVEIKVTEPNEDAKKPEPSAEDKAQAKLKKEQEKLALENSLADERVKKETAKLRAEALRLKADTELMTERLTNAAMKRRVDDEAEAAKAEIEQLRLARDAETAKVRAESLANELKSVQAQAAIDIARLQNEIQRFETAEKRKGYANSEPEYLAKPLRDDGTLVISDRRIALNGAITSDAADHVTERIHYFNNQNRELPIFLVIDESPGGSVMAGYRILKSMQASEAPIHVVVKSFAASMAAAITTLAEESYAYPNAIILHHQISAMLFGRLNLTQQAEFLKESQRWWERLADPIAAKMGITTDEFIKRMYASSTSGDWSEFGEQALELKWVNHIVSGIDETSLRRNPDDVKPEAATSGAKAAVETGVDEEGRPVAYLPRLNPKDVYFIYNPDGYYQLR